MKNRGRATDRERSSGSVAISEIGWLRLTLQMAARAAEAIGAGSPEKRRKIFIVERGDREAGTEPAPPGRRARPECRTSPDTPMTSNRARGPRSSTLPTGFSLGQIRSAREWLTTRKWRLGLLSSRR